MKIENDSLRDQALNAINNSYHSSPGYNIAHQTEQYLRSKDFTKALKIANLAIEHDEESPQAFAVRGDCYFHQSEIEKAVADYSRALKLNPGMIDLFLKRSDCYLIQKNNALAEEDLLLANRMRNKNPEVLESLGQFYRRTGQMDKAIPYLKKTLEISPTSFRGITAQTTLLLNEKGPKEAVEFLMKNDTQHQSQLAFQYTAASLYASASQMMLNDNDPENDQLAKDAQDKALSFLKKVEAAGSSKMKLISNDPAFTGFESKEGFKKLFDKHKISTEGTVGSKSPAKASSFSASIEAGGGVQQVIFEQPPPAKKNQNPQVVAGEVLLLAPPE